MEKYEQPKNPEEEKRKEESAEDLERLAYYLETHPDEPKEQKERRLEIEKLERLLDEFEAKHDLKELSAVNEITPIRETSADGHTFNTFPHPQRDVAKEDLKLIVEGLVVLFGLMPSEKENPLLQRYKKLSNAVGFVHYDSGKVRHS